MPIYEYKCNKCGNIMEFLVNISNNNNQRKCESCGSDKLDKLISSGNILSSHSKNESCCGNFNACNQSSCNEGECCNI